MDDSREQQLKEKTKQCQKTVSSLLEEYQNLLLKQKQTGTIGGSEHSVEQSPLVADVTKQLKDIELALESIQQHVQLALEQCRNTQPDLSTSEDVSTANAKRQRKSEANQMEIANVSINQQVGLSDDNNGQNEAKQTPTVQALFNGTLPDDVYLYLMPFMGIQECLLNNRLVCSFWDELIRDLCHNQKSLKLFETFDILMAYGELLMNNGKTEDTSLILKSIGDDLIFEGFETYHKQQEKNEEVDVQKAFTREKKREASKALTLFSKIDKHVSHLQQVEDVQKEVLTREKKREASKALTLFSKIEQLVNCLKEEAREPREASKVLTALFPTVEELVLCAEYDTRINIEHLLQFYAEQLTSLTMTTFGPWDESPGSNLRAFSFPKLKSLHTFYFSPEEDHLLSLLPQLESLTLSRTGMSLETLLRTGTQLEELNMHYLESVYAAPVNQFSRRPPINSNLRKFNFGFTGSELEILAFISHNLTSLECLKMNMWIHRDGILYLHSLTTYLVPLHKLHSLTLQAPVSLFLLRDNQFANIQPLPSVRHLKLLLSGNASLSSMERFSRALFAAFPNVEQVLIAFVDDVNAVTLAAFKDFAGKHPNIVQLFRSKDLSKFTTLPNAVSPVLGHHRQMYDDCIKKSELFGVPIWKLATHLLNPEGTDGNNLKIILRSTDRLTAMSSLLQILKSNAFTFSYCYTERNFKMVNSLMKQMVECALNYGPSEGALFYVTCKCIFSLLGCGSVKKYLERSFDGMAVVVGLFKTVLQLVEHYQSQQFNDKYLLRLIHNSMDKLIKDVESAPIRKNVRRINLRV